MSGRKVVGSKHLAEFVRQRRWALGLSRSQVVRMIQDREPPPYHLSESFLQNLEAGRTEPRLRQVLALSNLLQVDAGVMTSLSRLDAYDGARPAPNRFDVLQRLGKEAFDVGDFGRSVAAFEKAGELAPDLPRRLEVQCNLAGAVKRLGMLTLARWQYEAVLAEVAAEDGVQALAHVSLAGLCDQREHLEMGLTHLVRAEQLADPAAAQLQFGLQNTKGNLLTNRYQLHPRTPAHLLVQGRDCYTRALATARAAGNRRWEAIALANQGRSWCLAGEPAPGWPCLTAARELAEGTGDRWLRAAIEAESGRAHWRAGGAGDREQARRHLTRSLRLAREGDYPEWIVFCCILLLEIERAAGHPTGFFKKQIDRYRERVEKRFPELIRYEEQQHGGKKVVSA